MVSKVRGKFENFSGAITVAQDGTPSVSAEIAVDSINTGNEQRDNHVRSADFDAQTYPTATSPAPASVPTATTTSSPGTSHSRASHAQSSLLESNGVNPGMGAGPVAGFEATTVINRKDFGIDIEMPWRAVSRRRRQDHHHPGDRSRSAGLSANHREPAARPLQSDVNL